jgi:hypothetical protein
MCAQSIKQRINRVTVGLLTILFVSFTCLPFANGGNERTDWTKKESRQKLVQRLQASLNLTTAEDWYSVSAADINNNQGSGYIDRFSGRPRLMIMALAEEGLIPTPDGGWVMESFGKKVSWDRIATRRELAEKLKRNLGFKSGEEWYGITSADIRNAGGSGFLSRHKKSLEGVIRELSADGLIPEPQGGWDKTKFSSRTNWNKIEERRRLAESLKRILAIEKPEDWYQISIEDFQAAGGGSYLGNRFKNSVAKAIASLSNEELITAPLDGWQENRFGQLKKWNEKATREELVRELVKTASITKVEDWYKVTTEQFESAGGVGFLVKNSSSPRKAILSLAEEGLIPTPDGGWKEGEFGAATDWSLESSRIETVAKLIQAKQIETPEDWYNVSVTDFEKLGALRLLAVAGGLGNGIIALSKEGLIPPPTGGWEMHRFGVITNWDDKDNRRDLAERLKSQLLIKQPEDWYRVSKEDIVNAGGVGFRGKEFKGSPSRIILALSDEGFIVAPEGGWDRKRFFAGLKGQKLLSSYLEEIFGRPPLFNDRTSHGVRNVGSNRPLEADISFPDLRIAIEYQGIYHLNDEGVQARDALKRERFPANGWLLIEFWENKWNRKKEQTLEAVIEALPRHPDKEISDSLLKQISIGCRGKMHLLKGPTI